MLYCLQLVSEILRLWGQKYLEGLIVGARLLSSEMFPSCENWYGSAPSTVRFKMTGLLWRSRDQRLQKIVVGYKLARYRGSSMEGFLLVANVRY